MGGQIGKLFEAEGGSDVLGPLLRQPRQIISYFWPTCSSLSLWPSNGASSSGGPYSGSEGEMLRRGFSTVVASRALWKTGALVRPCPLWHFDKGRHPAATNRVARHSMSEDRAPSGGMHFASKRILRCRLEMAKKTLL